MSSIWNNETATYQRSSQSAPAYLPAADRLRWERLRHCQMLYRGFHRQYFLEEGRTQFRYPDELIDSQFQKRYITVNLLKLIANTTADLLFGAKAKLEAPTPEQKVRVDDLTRRSQLHARFHEAAVQMSWAGGAFLESTLWRGEPYIEVIPADEVYPQGSLMPDGQYERYVRYAVDAVISGTQREYLLLETHYEPGVIRRRLRKLDERGNPIGGDLPLERWPAFVSDPDRQRPEIRTGVPLNTITFLANKSGDSLCASDFDGLVSLQDTVNAKFSQTARILEKHADPKLRAPRSADGQISAADDVLFADNPDDYGYLNWPADLAAAMQDRDAAILAFCAVAEMSPVLLGIKRGATPDAARKLRLEATKDLAKVGRKALLVEPAIARAVEVALQLDQSTPLLRSYPIDPIGIEMRDGLPVDELDLAQAVATYRGAGAMSIEDAVELRKEDPDAAAAEIARIKAERSTQLAAMVPSVTLASPDGQEPGEDEPEEVTQ